MSNTGSGQEARYKASYRWAYGNGRIHRYQQWFVRDTETGEIVYEHFAIGRADAVYVARQKNDE